MAVSKRLRYEILRRDNHACRYCGAAAPDVKVTIDHVLPVALGGTDAPDNLVTACADCNNGKTSTTPGAPLVADVAEDALRWAGAMARAAQEAMEDTQAREKTYKAFQRTWKKNGGEDSDLPDNWRGSLNSLIAAGLPPETFAECVDIAFDQRHVYDRNRFKYTCGVAWRKIDKLRERAGEIAGMRQVPEASTENSKSEDEAQERAFFAHLGTVWNWGRLKAGRPASEEENSEFTDSLIAVMELEDLKTFRSGLTEAALRCGLSGWANLGEFLASAADESDENHTVPITLPEIAGDLFQDFTEDEREIYKTGAEADHGSEARLAVDFHALRNAWDEALDDKTRLERAVEELLGAYPEDLVNQFMDRSLAEHRENLGVYFTRASVTAYAVTLLLKSNNS